jgi:hypothetical protein
MTTGCFWTPSITDHSIEYHRYGEGPVARETDLSTRRSGITKLTLEPAKRRVGPDPMAVQRHEALLGGH